jgi:hypothetical protein
VSAFGRLSVVGILAVIALAPRASLVAVPPDATAPAELQVKLPAAKVALADALDRHQWTRVRYIGMEARASDNLVVLMFEMYRWPNILPSRAFLASRCRPLAEIEPRSMGGGVVDDFATDAELQHLRSPAQTPC